MSENSRVSKSVSQLSIHDLRIWAHLGVSTEEKHNRQLLSFNIDLIFAQLVPGAITDSLQDTICYAKIVRNLQEFYRKNQFNLVEHVTFATYRVVWLFLAKDNPDIVPFIKSIKVTGCKVAPPLEGVHGGIHFSYEADPNCFDM